MLYEVALRHVREADDALGGGRHEQARDRIGRALAVVDELTLTFDVVEPAELADHLLSVYRYCRRRLLEANQWRDRQALADVISAITPLYDVWSRVAAA